MNQATHTRGYVTFHQGKCYALEISVATADAQTFDPPARELSKKDWSKVSRALEEPRDSFRFLK